MRGENRGRMFFWIVWLKGEKWGGLGVFSQIPPKTNPPIRGIWGENKRRI